MRGRWTLASPLLILVAIALSALPAPAVWAVGGLAVAGLALLAGTRLLRRRPDGAEMGRRKPGAG
ncbi:MAG TPA: hypothetical protein VFK43_11225 [Acidimicrobiales bacterium]|nr:hypothetical protein [Acidimicrobiales bacterium]